MSTQTCEDPEIKQIQTQNQAEQGDWLKETWKKCSIKVIETTMRARLSVSEPTHMLFTCTLLFFPNKRFTYFITFCPYVEIHFYTADGPRPCHWPLPLPQAAAGN